MPNVAGEHMPVAQLVLCFGKSRLMGTNCGSTSSLMLVSVVCSSGILQQGKQWTHKLCSLAKLYTAVMYCTVMVQTAAKHVALLNTQTKHLFISAMVN